MNHLKLLPYLFRLPTRLLRRHLEALLDQQRVQLFEPEQDRIEGRSRRSRCPAGNTALMMITTLHKIELY